MADGENPGRRNAALEALVRTGDVAARARELMLVPSAEAASKFGPS